MRGVILAAGKGSRISAESNGLPKSFLEVNGKKIIQHQVAALRKQGVQDIVIVTGYKNWLFDEEFKGQPDIRLVKNPFFASCNVLGSLWFARAYMDQGFFFMHADTLFDAEILAKLDVADGDICFAVEFKQTVEEEMKVKVTEGVITEVNKTMACESAHGEFTGVAKIQKKAVPALVQYIEQIIERDMDHNTFFEHAIQKMIDAEVTVVRAVDIGTCRSIEIDFPEDYLRAKNVF